MTQHLWILVSNLSGSTVKHSYGGNGCCINVFKQNRQLYQGIEGQGRSNKENGLWCNFERCIFI